MTNKIIPPAADGAIYSMYLLLVVMIKAPNGNKPFYVASGVITSS